MWSSSKHSQKSKAYDAEGIHITKTFLETPGSQMSLLVYVTVENSDIKNQHYQLFVLIRQESLVSFLWNLIERY